MKLWRAHPAITHQRTLPLGARSNRRVQPTQANVLLGMLRAARANRAPLGLPAIMGAGIAQHGAPFKEIRERGFQVENEMEDTADGAVASRHWLSFKPEGGE